MRRASLAPEVIQSSAMDCGPAALKCLLDGHGRHVSYGRLREACHTDVDGTSIDTLEEVASTLGLDVEQKMIPADYLFAANLLPALVVVRSAAGFPHFVVAWQRYGPFIQIMDPARGRRWLTLRAFREELYIHHLAVDADAWREWAGSEESLRLLRDRLATLGLPAREAQARIDEALADDSWHRIAALDAAARCAITLRDAGTPARSLLDALYASALGGDGALPPASWPVRPLAGEHDGELRLRGAVVLSVRGLRSSAAPPSSPALEAAVAEPPARPLRELLALARQDRRWAIGLVAGGLAAAGLGVALEGVLFRTLLDVGRWLVLPYQRLLAFAALVVFLLASVVLHLGTVRGLVRIGRGVDIRLRLAFLRKLPRLGDRYFQSRLVSDMADRSHHSHQVRLLSQIGGSLVRSVCELAFVAIGIAWLDPASAPFAVLGAVLALALPLLFNKLLSERELRMRTHASALGRYHLDALLGLMPLRAHGAEHAIRREHDALLGDWGRAALAFQRAVMVSETLQLAVLYAITSVMLLQNLAGGDAAGALLIVYWALTMPSTAQEIATVARNLPTYRNVALRMLEPLGAPEEATIAGAASDADRRPGGVAIAMHGVTVKLAGHVVLRDVETSVRPGEHVAIVGASGAGKSTLLGLLLGFHVPADGEVLVDGARLQGDAIPALRRDTAWVDPGVQLWNRSLLANLRYGNAEPDAAAIGSVVDAASLRSVIESLPDGMQTALGEGGALVSGGEGQRVRLARALVRQRARLVVLDEPFRGLPRDLRESLLARARAWWRGATLFCVTHDVTTTQHFDRVLVVDDGCIVEQGTPSELAAQPTSRYSALLARESDSRWETTSWRRLQMMRGRAVEVRE